MAIGDRNKKGKPTDYVTHFVTDAKIGPICHTKAWVVGSNKKSEITCIRCLSSLNETEQKTR